jgi:hypothetical protein
MSLGNFELDISRFVEKAKGNVDIVIRKVSLDLFKRVIITSPVRTGRFKSNWQVAIGSIPGGVYETFDGRGSATIAKATAATLNAKAGDIIYLVNNLHYASRLEYGYSKQAPGGMVRIAVLEYSGVVNKAAGEVNK